MSLLIATYDPRHIFRGTSYFHIISFKFLPTVEMIIDFSRNYSLTSGIQSVTIGEQVLERVEHAKMLGVTISNNLTWSKHVDNIVSKAGKRVYMLYQLKRAGISQNDLVKIYVSIIRHVLEYACPVWSTSLPKYLSDAIEMIQKRVQ